MVMRPPPRHGVARVDRQVDHGLFDLRRIGLDVAGLRVEDQRQLDVFADQPPQHLLDVDHHRVDAHDARLDHLAAAEGQQLVGERGRRGRRL